MRGNTEASTTRRLCAPMTLNSLSITAIGFLVLPIGLLHEAWWPHASFLIKFAVSWRLCAPEPGKSSPTVKEEGWEFMCLARSKENSGKFVNIQNVLLASMLKIGRG